MSDAKESPTGTENRDSGHESGLGSLPKIGSGAEPEPKTRRRRMSLSRASRRMSVTFHNYFPGPKRGPVHPTDTYGQNSPKVRRNSVDMMREKRKESKQEIKEPQGGGGGCTIL